MADFQTPFGSNSGRRLPTADEKINGFPCGPADQTLFNGLFHRLEAELGQLISYAGLTGSDADNSQVRKAVEALISSATGGGDVSNYLLMTQARARLPIYPEVVSADGVMNISSPATGTVRVPGNVELVHRGIFTVTSAETDFNTQANKTYHVRWNPTDGFVLKDLADTSYNSAAAAESEVTFDSTYDDVILARVVTNSSNVATITNLANKHELMLNSEVDLNAQNYTYQDNIQLDNVTSGKTITLNWARKPVVTVRGITDFDFPVDTEMNIGFRSNSRYDILAFYQLTGNPAAQIWMTYVARA